MALTSNGGAKLTIGTFRLMALVPADIWMSGPQHHITHGAYVAPHFGHVQPIVIVARPFGTTAMSRRS